jgi:chemotaxis signal transduction protein
MEREEPSIGPRTRVPSTSWAFFACADQGYAVRVERVHEIVAPQPATRVPGCGREVYGLLGMRGRVITVFDFGVIAGGPASAGNPDHRLVLLKYGERVVGLAVDQVLTIAAYEVIEDEATARSMGRAGGAVALVAAGRTFTILDPDAVFGPRLA